MGATQIIPFTTEEAWLRERSKDLTSTEIPALFDCSKYTTEFELHFIKSEQISPSFEPNERVRWGSRLQDAIAAGVAQDNGWNVRKMSEYMRLPDERLGASFDFAIGDEGLLEIKNVDALQFRDGWIVDESGEIEAPLGIEFQVQQQLKISGRKFAYVAALVGGNTVKLLKREPDSRVSKAISDKAAKFWKGVDTKTPPKPNFSDDAEFISKLYQDVLAGKVFDARKMDNVKELAIAHYNMGRQCKLIEAERDAVKARLLMKIGDAEKTLGDGFTISASKVACAQISYDRAPYRTFRVTVAKEKVKG